MELFEQMIQHTSVRNFLAKKIPEAVKEKLVTAAKSPSSSHFIQAYSLIEVKDPEKLVAIENISNARGYTDTGAYYVFVADLNKHAQVLNQVKQDLTPLRTIESLVVAIVDATIAAQTMATYAESIDLGICYIGGLRNDLFRIKELLNLPELTYPIFGLTVGYPAKKNEVKPRIPLAGTLNIDSYQKLTPETLTKYDEIMASYYANRSSNQQNGNWSDTILQHFHQILRPDTSEFLKEQGFRL